MSGLTFSRGGMNQAELSYGVDSGERERPASDALRAHVLTLVRTQYAGFGPTFATEKLLEHDEIQVSRETLRKWMRDDGIWLTRSQRRSFHQSRIRRERLGELTQIDGSEHRWFGPNRPSCTLLVFIDDATSRLMTLLFEPPRVYRRVKYSKDEPYDEPEIHCC
ncbi:hypothetical protein JK217_13765, partial [Gluconobacter kondonii]|nr:hypothetical protein [Gluconobacter kondonii]